MSQKIRYCLDCGTDISDRFHNATLCRDCVRERRRVRDRNAKREMRVDADYRENARLYARSCRSTLEGRKRVNALKRLAYNRNEEKRDASNARRREAYRLNPAKYRSAIRRWRRANMEHILELNRSRRARQLGQMGNVSRNIKSKLRDAQGGKCGFCRVPLQSGRKVHLDHIVPLSKGGLHDDANLQLLCQECNLKKRDKDPIEFAQSNGRLF